MHALPRLGHKRPVFDARSGSNSFGDLPEWDLSDLYAAPDAPEVERDMVWLEGETTRFEAAYKSRLSGLDAAALLTCVQAYEAIDIIAGRLMSYAGLRYYQNTMDSERAKFMADAQDRPYRQRIYRLVPAPNGEVESVIHELPGDPLAWAGAWRETSRFSALDPTILSWRPGCSVVLS